ELLAPFVGDVAGGGQDPDGRLPLLVAEVDLGREGVEVAGEGLHQLAQAWVLAAFEAGHDRGSDVAGSGAALSHLSSLRIRRGEARLALLPRPKSMAEAYTLPCGFDGPSGRARGAGSRPHLVSPRSSRSDFTVSVAEMIARQLEGEITSGVLGPGE